MQDRDKILSKLRSLLQKTTANGCTEEEAMAAAEKADAIMAEYNLSMTDVASIQSQKFGFAGVKAATGKKRMHFHETKDCLMAVAYFCDIIGFPLEDHYMFFGEPAQCEFAMFLMDMIRAASEVEYRRADPSMRLALKRQGVKIHGHTIRMSFMAGFCNRVRSRLVEMRKARDVNLAASRGNELVVIKDKELQDQFEQQTGVNLNAGKDIVPAKKPQRRVHVVSYELGKLAGDKVNIGRPLEAKEEQVKIA